MIYAGTGHRDDKLTANGLFKPYTPELHTFLTYEVAQHVVAKLMDKDDSVIIISGMALGWDLALAEAAVYEGALLIAAIPFEGQEAKWSDYHKARYQALLDDAYEVVVVSEAGYAAWKMHARNRWMVDNCDVVLALSNGDKTGGTAACLNYAAKVGRPVKNLWPYFLKQANAKKKQRLEHLMGMKGGE